VSDCYEIAALAEQALNETRQRCESGAGEPMGWVDAT